MRIELLQNTPAWDIWRKEGLGASEAASAMGLSPWRSPHQLWMEKTNRAEGFKGNDASRRGQELEPEARMRYNLMMNAAMEPACYQHDDLPFLRASLDGIDETTGIILEIKCSGTKVHESVMRNDSVPDYYYPQIQQQLLCCNSDLCHYVSYNPDHEVPMVIVVVKADPEFQARLVTEAGSFWKLVVEDVPPESDEQAFTLIEDEEFRVAVETYNAMKTVYESQKSLYDQARKDLIDFTDDGNCRGYGIKMIKVIKKGNIDWEAVKKEYGIKDDALEKFRKKESQYWLIKDDTDD